MIFSKFWIGICCIALPAAGARAEVETVVVTGSALPGTALDPNDIAATIQTLSSDDLVRLGPASILRGLDSMAGGVSLSGAQDNPFQPNLFYHGFEASPLSGDAQGLAVYVDGVRFNQPFGDAVNWDVIPDVAIDRLTLEGSNPVFGLNALGGSVSVRMKDGFAWQGTEAEVYAASYGREAGSVQFGHSDGTTALYAAGTLLTDSGWRDHSPSHLAQAFADFGWHGPGAELHLDLIGASNAVTGNGTSPVELLAVDRSAVFTFPDKTDNRYGLANLFGSVQVDRSLALQGNVYISHLDQRTKNGDASDLEPCRRDRLCLEDGTLVTGLDGNPIPDFLDWGPYAQLNRTSTDTLGFGGSGQASLQQALFGFENQLIVGLAYDAGRADFAAQSDLGALSLARGFVGPGITIDIASGEIAPVKVKSDNDYLGAYAADILKLSPQLSLNLSARFNYAHIRLDDQLGTALNGSHEFTHFNPAIGATYKLLPEATLYAGYAQANRAPTPAEFSCADENAPCSLTNFFVADPPLKQVMAQTVDAGARGEMVAQAVTLRWHAELYRIETDDDIMFVASPITGRAFFRNIGTTRRQGVDLGAEVKSGPWFSSISYTLTDATFRSALTLDSPDNPLADDDGQIHVKPGDHLPSIARHLVKLNLTYQPSDTWSISASGRYASGQFLRGDESNLNPQTRPYAVVDIAASYRLAEHWEVFGGIENLFDTKYETFGSFSPVEDVPMVEVPGADNPRSLSPGAPLTAFGGVRASL